MHYILLSSIVILGIGVSACSSKLGRLQENSTLRIGNDFGDAHIETVLDEIKGTASEIDAVTIIADGQQIFYRRAGTPPKERIVWTGGLGAKITKTLHVTWRKNSGWNDVPVGDPRRIDQFYRDDVPLSDINNLKWSEGVVSEDYIIAVANRIPEAVRASLRLNPDGATLRIKVRIYPNTKTHRKGVALGWDIQRSRDTQSTGPAYESTGGDFKEARKASYYWVGDVLKNVPTDALSPEATDLLRTGEYFVPVGHSSLWERGWHLNNAGEKIWTDY